MILPAKTPLVLTIEDDDIVRNAFIALLEDAEYRVSEASNGIEGLKRFNDLQPDLVLVDLRMPEMDGLEVLTEITKTSPNTPVIVVTASDVMDDAIQAIRRGAADYLIKPIIDPSLLYHAINKNLESSRLAKQNELFRKNLEEQLRRITEDEQAGKRIQTRLLPPESRSYGDYIIRQTILPSMALSGDFADYFCIDDDRFAFYFADVSGHGVSSALVTVLLKSFMVKHRDSFIAKSDQTILDPSALVQKLNGELIREKLDKHLTLFFAIVDSTSNSMLYCNCGQFPYPVLEQKDGVQLIEDKNMPVGMFPFAAYKNAELQLPDEFRINIFSDGVLDIIEPMGLNEKIDYLASLKTEDAIQQFLDTIRQIDELPDDVSVLSVEKQWS